MKKNRIFKSGLLIAVVSLISFSSCKANLTEYTLSEVFYRYMNVERRATNLRNLNISSGEDKSEINTNIKKDDDSVMPLTVNIDDVYDVLVITDVHFGNSYLLSDGKRHDAEWYTDLEDKKLIGSEGTVKFALCLGDVAEHGALEECEDFNKEITDVLENTYGIPLYNVVGNHDLFNSGWANWQKTMYPHTSFYKFETPSFSWYFVDSASGTLGEYQLDALSAAMRTDPKKKLIFSHVPVYADNLMYFTMQNTDERNRLISLCASTSTLYFIDGHTHKEISYDFGSFFEQNIAAFINSHEYGVIHVDEANDEVSMKLYKF